MLKIIKENKNIKVKSSYNEKFIKLAKMINGKWNSPYWEFPIENEDNVRDICLKVYGENGLINESVDLIIDLNLAKSLYDDKIKIGDVILCERKSRDWDVTLSDNVMVLEGEFCSSGGSAKYPRVTWKSEEMKIKVKNFPYTLFDKIEDKTGIVATKSATNTEKLLKEKEELLKRLTEINKMLGSEKNA